MVYGVDTKALFFEIGKTEGCIPLGPNMQHVEPGFASDVDVCAVGDKQFDQFDVAMVARVMERVKSLVIGIRNINPIRHHPTRLLLYSFRELLIRLCMIPVQIPFLQMFRQPLLVEADQKVGNLELVLQTALNLYMPSRALNVHRSCLVE